MSATQLPAPVATRDEVLRLTAGDGHPLTLVNVRADAEPTHGPVLLVHGAGVRADIFRAPVQRTIVDELVAAGYDVWLENWRASIDHPPNEWDLDQAAVHDHPVAVRAVLEHTGASTLKAIVHCQGSTSFALSAVAGLLPEVDTIISNAVSLHPVVPAFSRFKLRVIRPVVAKATSYLDPAWGDRPTGAVAQLIRATVLASHRECDERVCRMVSFTYGSGRPALWSHENLNHDTHGWVAEQFGPVPFTFFQQIARGSRAGRLVSTGREPSLPSDVAAQPPRTDARFVLLAGADNRCFLPASQEGTFAFLDALAPGKHRLHVLPGYGHLDVFMGEHAWRDVFPLILAELEASG